MLSDLSVRASVLTQDVLRKSPVSGGFDFLYLCSICRLLALLAGQFFAKSNLQIFSHGIRLIGFSRLSSDKVLKRPTVP